MRREKSRTRGGGTERERKMRMGREKGERKRRKRGDRGKTVEWRGLRARNGEDPCL